MKHSDIFKVQVGTRIRGLSGAEKDELVEVAEVSERVLRADCAKFSVSFRDTKGRLWTIREVSAAEISKD